MFRKYSVIFAASLALLSTLDSATCFAAAAPAQPRDDLERPRFLKKEIKRFVFSNTTTSRGGPSDEVSTSDLEALHNSLTSSSSQDLGLDATPTSATSAVTTTPSVTSSDREQSSTSDVSLSLAGDKDIDREALLALHPTTTTALTSSTPLPSSTPNTREGTTTQSSAVPGGNLDRTTGSSQALPSTSATPSDQLSTSEYFPQTTHSSAVELPGNGVTSHLGSTSQPTSSSIAAALPVSNSREQAPFTSGSQTSQTPATPSQQKDTQVQPETTVQGGEAAHSSSPSEAADIPSATTSIAGSPSSVLPGASELVSSSKDKVEHPAPGATSTTDGNLLATTSAGGLPVVVSGDTVKTSSLDTEKESLGGEATSGQSAPNTKTNNGGSANTDTIVNGVVSTTAGSGAGATSTHAAEPASSIVAPQSVAVSATGSSQGSEATDTTAGLENTQSKSTPGSGSVPTSQNGVPLESLASASVAHQPSPLQTSSPAGGSSPQTTLPDGAVVPNTAQNTGVVKDTTTPLETPLASLSSPGGGQISSPNPNGEASTPVSVPNPSVAAAASKLNAIPATVENPLASVSGNPQSIFNPALTAAASVVDSLPVSVKNPEHQVSLAGPPNSASPVDSNSAGGVPPNTAGATGSPVETGSPVSGTASPGGGSPVSGTASPGGGSPISGTASPGGGSPASGTASPGGGSPVSGTASPGGGSPVSGTASPGGGSPISETASPGGGSPVSGTALGGGSPVSGTASPGGGSPISGTASPGGGSPVSGTASPDGATGSPVSGIESPAGVTASPGGGSPISGTALGGGSPVSGTASPGGGSPVSGTASPGGATGSPVSGIESPAGVTGSPVATGSSGEHTAGQVSLQNPQNTAPGSVVPGSGPMTASNGEVIHGTPAPNSQSAVPQSGIAGYSTQSDGNVIPISAAAGTGSTVSNGQVVPAATGNEASAQLPRPGETGAAAASIAAQSAAAVAAGASQNSAASIAAQSAAAVAAGATQNNVAPPGPTATPAYHYHAPQEYAGKGPYTQSPVGYDTATTQVVPTSIIHGPSSTPSATQGHYFGPSSLPSNVPQILYQNGGPGTQPPNTRLVNVAFRYPLNYYFVYNNTVSQQQIFYYIPLGICYGLEIEISQITMQSLRAWDTYEDVGYVKTLALAWIPEGLVDNLGLLVSTPVSRFYLNPDNSTAFLLSMIDDSIPITGSNGTDGGSAPFGNIPSDTNSKKTAGAPIGGDIGNSEHVRASSVGIGVGVACGAAAYGAAMFFVARRYKKRRQSHMRSPSMLSSPVMSHAGPDAGAGAALMSGAMGDRSASPYYDNDGRADSRGSGRSGSSRHQISAPVMAENSLGWN